MNGHTFLHVLPGMALFFLSTNNAPAATFDIANGDVAGLNHFGGGIYNDHAALTIINCTLAGNSAKIAYGSGDGGAIYNNGKSAGQATLTVKNSTFSDNMAAGYGGGIYNDGDLGGSA